MWYYWDKGLVIYLVLNKPGQMRQVSLSSFTLVYKLKERFSMTHVY